MTDKKKKKLHNPFHLHIPNFILTTTPGFNKNKFTGFQVPHVNVINPSASVYEPKLLLGKKTDHTSDREKGDIKDFVAHNIKNLDEPITKKKKILSGSSLTQQDTRKMRLYKELELLANHLRENSTIYELKYLNYSLPKQSEHFTSFNLIERSYEVLDKFNYYTLTHEGITYWSGTENNFVSLDEWQEQYKMFFKIIQIKTFLRFRLWKGYIVWLKTIKWQKYYAAKSVLESQLLIANEHVAEAILRLKKRIYEYHGFCLIDTVVNEDFHLFYFIEKHLRIYENFVFITKSLRTESQKFLYDACMKAIIAEGFYPIDEILVYPSVAKMREAMSYMDRAKKRTFCKLLSNFLTYCDYLILNMLHEIMARGYAAMVSIAQTRSNNRKPGDIRRQSYFKKNETKSFFYVDLILQPEALSIDPSEEISFYVFKKLTTLWLDAMKDFDNFTDDPFFLQFTKPSIMGRQEDKQTGVPPSLLFLLKSDTVYKLNEYKIFNSITKSYKDIYSFITRYEDLRKDYRSDVFKKPLVLNDSLENSTYRKYAAHYRKNIEFGDKINIYENIGIIKLQQTEFKDVLLPVYRELLQNLENFLIKTAMQKIEVINLQSEDIINEILILDTTYLAEEIKVEKFVNLKKKIDIAMKQVDVVHDMFMIMKIFKMVVDDTKKEIYMDCENLVNTGKDMLLESWQKVNKDFEFEDDTENVNLQKIHHSGNDENQEEQSENENEHDEEQSDNQEEEHTDNENPE